MTLLDYLFLAGYLSNYVLAATAFEGYVYLYNRFVIFMEGVAHAGDVAEGEVP